MAITSQPAYDSLYSAYSQISVGTHVDTPGLEVKTQDFDKANMISLNIIDSEQKTEIDNSAGTGNNFYKTFPVYRQMVAGEWYTFKFDRGVSGDDHMVSVAFFQGNDEGRLIETKRMAFADLELRGGQKTWTFQIGKDIPIVGRTSILVVYAGYNGTTAGKKVTLYGMTLAYGRNPVSYRPSTAMAVNSLTESTSLHRDPGFGLAKMYDLRFLAKAGFRDLARDYQYASSIVDFGIDYNLVSAYAYRGIGDQDFNVRYASRGVRPRGYNVNFSVSDVGLILTDRTPDDNRNLCIKKYFGYPYYLTLFPKGVYGVKPSNSVDVRFKSTTATREFQFVISTRVNIPLVREFDDYLDWGADYMNFKLSEGTYPHKAWNITFADTEVPCNPFYIRWINQKGGWDTYMFEQHKKYTQEVDRGDQYVLANAQDPYVLQTRGELAPEVKNIVQAGAEQIDENDFNLLKGIALSPLVQVYNRSIERWQRVLVDDTDLTWDTRVPRNTVNFEFQLIDERIQW